MVPVAPGLLSTIQVPPSFSGSFCASTRAMASVEPPGGKGTTSVTGLSGQAKALAAAAASARPIRVFLIMGSLLCFWDAALLRAELADQGSQFFHFLGLQVRQGRAHRAGAVADDGGTGLDDGHGIAF